MTALAPARHPAEQREHGLATDLPVDPALAGGNGTFDGADVARGVAKGVLQRMMGGPACCRHHRLAVVQRDDLHHQDVDEGVDGTEKTFGAASAFCAMHVHHAGAPLCLKRLGDGRGESGAHAHGDGDDAAELHELAAGHATVFSLSSKEFCRNACRVAHCAPPVGKG